MGKERWVLILAWRIDDKLALASLVLKRADHSTSERRRPVRWGRAA